MSSDRAQARADSPGEYPYTESQTLIFNLAENQEIARIHAPVWPHVGAVIELGSPHRDAVVVGVRMRLGSDDVAVILVDVTELVEGETISREPADRLLQGEG